MKELTRADGLLSDVQVVLKLAGFTGDALVDDDPGGEAVSMDPEWLARVDEAVTRTDPLVGDLDVLEDGGLLLELDLHPLQQRGQCTSAYVVHLLFIAVEEERLLATAKPADLILVIQLLAPDDHERLSGNILLVRLVALLLPDAFPLVFWADVVGGRLVLKVQKNQ